MSHTTHPHIPLSQTVRDHRRLAIAALAALMATTAVVLVLVIGNDSSEPVSTPAQVSSQSGPQVRPDESRVAAAVGTQPSNPMTARPDESRVASAIATESSAPALTRPDESNVASAISGSQGGSKPDRATQSQNGPGHRTR